MTLTLFSNALGEYANLRLTGTRMPGASARDRLDSGILLPREKVLKLFDKAVLPGLNKGIETIAASRQLGKIRDTLQPKLLPGQLTIPEAE